MGVSLRLTVTALCLPSFLCYAAGQTGAGAASAVEAARIRQETVKTAVFEFRRTEVTVAGGSSETFSDLANPKVLVPAKETTLVSTNRLVIDGDKVRFEDNHPIWHMPDGKLFQTRAVGVFNGTVANKFFPAGVSGRGDPVGVIEAEANPKMVRSYLLAPITMTLRGLNPAFNGYPVNELKATGVTLPIEGASCEERSIKTAPDGLASFWFDPGKDFILKRIRTQKGGRTVGQTDVQYRQDGSNWVPISWVMNQYSTAGRVLVTNKVEVLDVRLNEPQAADQFEIRYPPGTQVHNNKINKIYRIQPDGMMQEISLSGELLSGSVAQPGDSWFRRNKWLSVATVCAAVLVILAIGIRRHKLGPQK